MRRKIQILVLVILCAIFAFQSLTIMDVFPDKLSRSILSIDYEGTISNYKLEQFHGVITLENKGSKNDYYLPTISSFDKINNTSIGQYVKKKKLTYSLTLTDENGNTTKIKFPQMKSCYPLDLTYYGLKP